MKLRNWNSIALGIISLGFLVLFRFFMSDPRDGSSIRLTLPGGFEIPWISCPFRAITGIPCPSCGITRSLILMVHGDIAGSFRMHPLGPVVVIAAIMAVVYLPFAIVKPVSDEVKEKKGNKKWGWIVVVVILLAWAVNLSRHFRLIVW